ncbi:MAG: PAS domain-containing protein [Sneathiella sp.]
MSSNLIYMRKVEQQKRSDNFRKVIRESVTSADDFKTDTVRSLYRWWEGFQPELPRRADFDIAKHWKIAPSLYLVEVMGPGQYRNRLNGETVVDIVGSSLRGHDITPQDPLPEIRLLSDYLDTLVAGRTARRCSGVADVFGKQYLSFETVDCPLVDEADDIRYIIGAMALTR